MSSVALRPDAELAVRSWLRAQAIDGLGKNVFFGAPDSNVYPRAQCFLVGGTDDQYVEVFGEDEVQIDVLATNKATAYEIARTVVALVKGLVDGTPMGSAAIGKGARVVLGPLWRPEDERLGPDKKSAVARYVIGARFSLIPSA